jgi:asparagine synthase (glutamine-hydrolysing)
MCGIYGITENNPELIYNYIKQCKHRGPDGEKVWWHPNNKLTMGHNLLSIMADPKLSVQPWKTPKGNWLIYNGEIFNYYELKNKHSGKGFTGITGCDTELLAWGLDTYGLDFINEIDSMHSFAYYKVDTNELWLSRDHAGIKPLYYAEIKQGLIFGSEIKGMLDHVPGSRIIDPLAFSSMATVGLNPTENTFFSNIKKLLCGETIIYDLHNKKIKNRVRNIIIPSNDQKFDEEEFRQVTSDSVKLCSIGRRKIGIFLSGGLDSGMVAYEYSKLHDTTNTYTNKMEPNIIWRKDDHNDDHNKALQLAKQHNFNHKVVTMTPQILADMWDDSIYYMEQPVYNPSMVMYYYTNQILSKDGIVVTLAGDMGDEVLGGYPKYWKLRNKNVTSWKGLIEAWMNRIKRPIQVSTTPISRDDLSSHFEKTFPQELYDQKDPVNSYMALDCVTQVPEEFFIRNDTYGMAFSMEGRFPLATKKFMKYALGIPSREKIGRDKSDTKLLSKKAYRKIFPKEIVNKHKTGWTAPVKGWIQDQQVAMQCYQERINRQDCLKDIVVRQNETQKSAIPAWILRDWANKFNMKM